MFGSSESPRFGEVEDPRGTSVTVIVADVIDGVLDMSGNPCVNRHNHRWGRYLM